ncbi:MAG: 3-deoxy-D-manno-octulosonic-acid transferase [Saprospiraceae bacterium]|jgi:3-deoxy-D-manno-octulosonic-acid transferase
MVWLYNFGIFLYRLAIGIASFFSPKARLWVSGRKDLFSKIKAFRKQNEDKLVWFHCASLGEFEQGRPVIEGLKRKKPDWKIVVTFYSPSGYEIRKNYALADAVFYLPLDTKNNAQNFIKSLRPDYAVFVKYEFWYHHLFELNRRSIPTLLISSIFRKEQIFFKCYGGLHRQMLNFFDHIFVQDKLSLLNLKRINIQNVIISGDTRIDQVLSIAKEGKAIPNIAFFKGENQLLVCGSTWEKDEKILAEVIADNKFPDWKFIIAPHEIGEKHLKQIEAILPLPTIRFSKINEQNSNGFRVLLIDNIGLLSALYRYGDLAYIGGGFGAGIHNTLEPMAHGLPVIIGPKYQKFSEAIYLVKSGGGFSINNKNDLQNIFTTMSNEEMRKLAAEKAKRYILENEGASIGVIKIFS